MTRRFTTEQIIAVLQSGRAGPADKHPATFTGFTLPVFFPFASK
jgi:hypothetical protein